MLTRKSIILAKIESTYGTDPIPTTTNDALIAFDLEIAPETDPLERADLSVSLSRLKELGGKRRISVNFMTELRGSGAAGTPPEGIGALLQACAMQETIVPATSVTYAPASSGFKSVTLYVYMDGILHQVQGCVGDVEISVVAGEIPMLKWKIKGLYETPTDIAFPSSYGPDATVPVPAKNLAATFDAYAAVIHELTLKLNNVLTERPHLGAIHGVAGFQVTDRNPEGEIIIEAVTLATKNFWPKFEGDTVQVLSMAIGSVAGNICTISANQCRIRQLPYEDADGIWTQPIPFQLARNVSNDELSIVFT